MSTTLLPGMLVSARFWTADSEQASINVINYRVPSVTGVATTDQDMANYLDLQMASVYKPLIYNAANYRGVQVAILGVTPRPATVFSNTHAGAGTAGATGLPRQTCGLVSYQTALGGRRFRGRTYLPFPTTADNQTNGTPTPGYLTLLTNWLAQLFASNTVPNAGATGSAAILPVLNHRAGKTPIPATVTDITHSTVSPSWATQRRRGSFGRANSVPI